MIFFVSGSKKEVIPLNKNERALNKVKAVVDKDIYLTLLVMIVGETIYFPAADVFILPPLSVIFILYVPVTNCFGHVPFSDL